MGNPHTGRNSRSRLTMRANTIWMKEYACREAATMRIRCRNRSSEASARSDFARLPCCERICSRNVQLNAASMRRSGGDRVEIHAVSKKFLDLLGVRRIIKKKNGVLERRDRAECG